MEFKILLVGERSVGKGSFIHVCRSPEFKNTAPINSYLYCPTNYGTIRLNLTQSHNYEDGYDFVLIMVDASKSATYKILFQIPDNSIPKIIVANKYDLKNTSNHFPKVKQQQLTSRKYPYFDISVLKCYGIVEVISALLKQLVSKDIYLV